MQRRAFTAGATLAVALSCGLAACTTDFSGGDATSGGGADQTYHGTAEPGRHSGLPEPCGAVDKGTLSELLPAAGSPAYEGEPALTYDTDRRVGCTWRSPTDTGAHQLEIDFERVVSYDADISDNDRAELDFRSRATAAGLAPDGTRLPEPDTAPETQGTAGAGGTSESPPDSGISADPADAGDEQAESTPPNSSEGPDSTDSTTENTGDDDSTGKPAPRELDGIGHAAFVDDRLTDTGSGTRRDITLVFHSANVIVTVRYTESTTDVDHVLDGDELQERAQALAEQLAERFES